jgi:hypothetical protein
MLLLSLLGPLLGLASSHLGPLLLLLTLLLLLLL